MLDPLAALVCIAVSHASLGLMFGLLALSKPDRRWSAPWCATFILSSLGTGLVSLRGLIPDVASIQVSNALLLMAGGLAWNAARLFHERRPNWVALYLGPALWLLLCQVPEFYNSLGNRAVAFSMMAAVYSLCTAAELARDRQTPSLAQRLVILVLGVHALVLVVRSLVVIALIGSKPFMGLPDNGWFMAFLLEALANSICVAFAVLAMARERAVAAEQRNLIAAAQAARSANEAKSRFLARLSHDLRTPLNSMLGFAQVLASDQRLHDEQRHHATTLAEGGRHLLNLLNDLVDLARIEAGRLTLNPVPIDLMAFLNQSVALVRADAATRGMVPRLVTAGPLPAMVMADETRLRQVLLNLLSNAIKYGAANEAVELTVSQREGDQLRFSVADRGPGIAPGLRQRLFEDYARLHIESMGPSGAGLGLSISQALARAMGGQLAYADRPGGGALFNLDVKLPPYRSEQEAALAPVARVAAVLRVLVVEDLRPNRRVLRRMLEQGAHEVLEAEDMTAALTMVSSEPLDLVLLDLDAPNGEGLMTFRAIRARGTLARATLQPIPVIAMTRQPEELPPLTGVGTGLAGIVPKPVTRERLMPLVEVQGPVPSAVRRG